MRKAKRGEIWAVGQDTTVFKVRGQKSVVGFITDAIGGGTLSIEFMEDEDAESLQNCLQRVAGPDLKVLISDDAKAYGLVAEAMGLEHQLCIAHAKKAFIRSSDSILKQTRKDHPSRKEILKGTWWLKRAMARGKRLSVRLWKRAKERLHSHLLTAPPGKGQQATPARMNRVGLISRSSKPSMSVGPLSNACGPASSKRA